MEAHGASTTSRFAMPRHVRQPLALRSPRGATENLTLRQTMTREATGRAGTWNAPRAMSVRAAQGWDGSRSIRRVTTRSTTVNHERAHPARGFPVTRSQAARVCLRSCRPGRVLSQASSGARRKGTPVDVTRPRSAPTPLAGTGPPSLVSGGQGRRPFRYPRARLTRLGAPKSPLQSTRPVMRRSSGARGRHTKMAATRIILDELAAARLA